MKHFIYGLQDPTTSLTHYVGVSVNPKARLRAHISEARSNLTVNQNLTIWILRLLLSGKEPVTVTLEETDEENWRYKERFWINKMRKNKQPICNKRKGGEGGKGYRPPSAVTIYLSEHHRQILDNIEDDIGDNHTDIIAEAIDNYWGKYDAGRTDSLARAIEDDARGDGYLLGTEASVAGKPSGDGPDKD